MWRGKDFQMAKLLVGLLVLESLGEVSGLASVLDGGLSRSPSSSPPRTLRRVSARVSQPLRIEREEVHARKGARDLLDWSTSWSDDVESGTDSSSMVLSACDSASEYESDSESPGHPLVWRPKTRGPMASIKHLFSEVAPTMSVHQAQICLAINVLIFGINYGLVKYVTTFFGSSTILAARFGVAAFCLLPWLSQVDPKIIPLGLETGGWMAAGYLSQALCMAAGTKAGTTAFLAALTSVLTPFLEVYYGAQLTASACGAACLALIGGAFLSLDSGGLPTSGDIIGLLQPLLFSVYLIKTERTIRKHPSQAMELTSLQVAVSATAAVLWGLLAPAVGLPGGFNLSGGLSHVKSIQSLLPGLACLLFIGVVPTAFLIAIQMVVLNKLPSSVTAVAGSMRPVFAAASGSVLLGETFGVNAAIGGALSVAAVVVKTV